MTNKNLNHRKLYASKTEIYIHLIPVSRDFEYKGTYMNRATKPG